MLIILSLLTVFTRAGGVAGTSVGVAADLAACSLHPILHALQRQAGHSLVAGSRRRLRLLRRLHRDGFHQWIFQQPRHDVRATVRTRRQSAAIL